jgi:RNA polymerase sigma factor (sigma-70 family)
MVDDAHVAAFDSLRPLLFSVAYRILGRPSDAEDVVQEAWLRYAPRAGDVDDPRAWLIRAITRLSLDELRSAHSRRERYVGPWLPEPVLTGQVVAEDPLELVERRELLSLGALAMLERLTAAERAVLVLREALQLSHAEIAAAVGITEVSSRQLLARARRRIASSHARAVPSAAEHGRLVDALLAAFRAGDVRSLVSLLRDDAVAVTDGGGEALAARRPILGRDRVLRLFTGLLAKAPPELRIAPAGVNGSPGFVIHAAGDPVQVGQLVVDPDGRISEILFVVAPSKLEFARRQRPRLEEAVTNDAAVSS